MNKNILLSKKKKDFGCFSLFWGNRNMFLGLSRIFTGPLRIILGNMGVLFGIMGYSWVNAWTVFLPCGVSVFKSVIQSGRALCLSKIKIHR